MDPKGQEIAELKAKLDAANKAKDASAKELEQASEVVQDLKQKLAEKPDASGAETFGKLTVGKVEYELTVPSFNHLGEIVTIDVLNAKSKLAEALVKDSVSFLRKVA